MKKLVLVLMSGLSVYSYSQMTMNSIAAMTNPGDCNCYNVTNNTTNKKGAIWSVAPIDLNQSFDMTFQIFAGNSAGFRAPTRVFIFIFSQKPNARWRCKNYQPCWVFISAVMYQKLMKYNEIYSLPFSPIFVPTSILQLVFGCSAHLYTLSPALFRV